MRIRIVVAGLLIVFLAAIFLASRATKPRVQPKAVAQATQLPIAKPKAALPAVPAGNRISQQEQTWRRAPQETVFGTFVNWSDSYKEASSPNRNLLARQGIELAQQRRAAMAEMIQSDPETALALAVPASVRRSLPSEIQNLLEERISARGDLLVLGALPEPGKEKEVVPTFRRAVIDDRELKAFVYGRRLGEPVRTNIPLHGIAIDGFFAVSENPVRVLEPVEAAEAKASIGNKETFCGISQEPSVAMGGETVVDVGDEILFLCRPGHVEQLNEKLIEAENNPEPSAYTEGQKKLILIRVNFPDMTNVPFADQTGINLISNLNNFYRECSYQKTTFALHGQGSELTPTFQMTNNAAYYGTNDYYNKLRTEARAAATAAGYVLSDYNFDVICFGSVPGWSWAGLGYVGSPGSWLRNSFGTGVAAHELGHNVGLNHANYWNTTNLSTVGPGNSVEYGDSFDTMGSASAGNNHFNARYKNYLNWLTSSDIVTYTTNGTYRIFAHDNTNTVTGFRALRIARNTSTNYWVEFRQKFTSNRWLTSGAGLRWAQSSNQKSQLLDTTPGSPDGKNDAAIVIGRTFTDPDANIHITPIGKGGTSPESLDVVVFKGTFPTNLAPIVTVSAPVTNGSTGASLSFTAAASDPNGDPLAYYWDFGDGFFGTNGPAASKSWGTAGEYVVRCTASDMRGGSASSYVIVRIGNPSTHRISGRIVSGTNGVHGVRVYVSTTRMAYTDTDGNYTIVGLPSGTYTVNASLYPFTFVASGFTNPVVVNGSVGNINFFDSKGMLPPSITAHPQSLTVRAGSNATFAVATAGTSPTYQWRFGAANIANATNSTYTVVNAQTNHQGAYSVVVSNAVGTATSVNAQLGVVVPPVLSSIPNVTVNEGTALAFSAVATGYGPGNTRVITDFESFASGSAAGSVMFRNPNYSSTTSAFLDTSTTASVVTNVLPPGNLSGRALKVTWSFKTGTTSPWLRLTTASTASLPNPAVHFAQRLQFDVRSDRDFKVGLGLRETGTSANIGADGGLNGPIEFVGVPSKTNNAPIPSRTVASDAWTTLSFDIPTEPVTEFTGDGILQSATGKGALECLALVPAGGTGAYNVYLDNFTMYEGYAKTFSLATNSPPGASINPATGQFLWTPTEAQGPGTYTITVRVADNSTMTNTDSKTFTVTVREVNQVPELASVTNRIVHVGNTVSFTNSTVDGDIPANSFTYNLLNAPAGATINSAGVFTWTPGEEYIGTNELSVVVSDSGSPTLSDTETFDVVVVPAPAATSMVGSVGNMTLQWTTIAGRRYKVQSKDDLAQAEWTNLDEFTADGETTFHSYATGSAQKFYRIVALD